MKSSVLKFIAYTLIAGLCIFMLFGCVIFEDTELVSSDSTNDFNFLGPVQQSKTPAYAFKDLLDAIEWVESKGDPRAVGDNGDAIGAYQIHPIMVLDINRILGYNRYTLNDRYDLAKSREMCKVYLGYYCKNKSLEYMARCWNGGPTGHKKQSTEIYWAKIQMRLGKR